MILSDITVKILNQAGNIQFRCVCFFSVGLIPHQDTIRVIQRTGLLIFSSEIPIREEIGKKKMGGEQHKKKIPYVFLFLNLLYIAATDGDFLFQKKKCEYEFSIFFFKVKSELNLEIPMHMPFSEINMRFSIYMEVFLNIF